MGYASACHWDTGADEVAAASANASAWLALAAALPADPQPTPSDIDFGAVADVLESAADQHDDDIKVCLWLDQEHDVEPVSSQWLRTQATRLRALGGES